MAVKRVCNTCQGKGLLPLILPDGTLSRHARRHCPACYNPYHDNGRRQPQPEDYDYPMSWSQWRSICQQNGWRDPGSDEDTPPVRRESSSRIPDIVELRALLKQNEQMRAQLNYLTNKVMEKRVNEKRGNLPF